MDNRKICPMVAIDQLPVKVFHNIFDKFLESGHLIQTLDDSTRPLLSNNFHADPTVLGQVCSSLREVALGYPKLWHNILILNPKKSQVYLTEQWLQRAGTAPLNLMIRITKDPKDAKDRDEEAIATRSILRSIFSRTEHWREIDLQLATNVMTPDMVSTLQDSKTCSRLEFANVMFKSHDSNLLLLHHWEWGNDVYMEFWKFFSQSPSLCQVGWTYCPQEIILADTQRDQLTQVSLFSSVYLQGLITLLIHAQSLVWLSSFIFRGIDTTSSIPSGTVDLNRLHTLKVDFGCERISTLLDYITCPSLRDLEIASSLSNDQALSDSDSFRQFLSRSRCQVNDLSLGGGGISARIIIGKS